MSDFVPHPVPMAESATKNQEDANTGRVAMEVVDERMEQYPGVSDRVRWLRVEDAARRVGVSPRTMRRLVLNKQIRHRKVGRIVRISDGDVEEFLVKATVDAAG
jgi:excisionase family DNA binding protein